MSTETVLVVNGPAEGERWPFTGTGPGMYWQPVDGCEGDRGCVEHSTQYTVSRVEIDGRPVLIACMTGVRT